MFNEFKIATQKQFERMKKHDLYRVQIDKDLLWQTYLSSFPEGTNPIFRERTEHDCQCCKQFIRAVGNVIAIIDGEIESIWDVQVGGHYQIVADALSALVKKCTIEDVFLHIEQTAGTDKNYQNLASGEILTWEHFFVQIPSDSVMKKDDIGTKLADFRSSRDVLYRSLTEITTDAIDTVLDLIAQNSLYRGEENKFAVESFQKLKTQYTKLKTDKNKDIFCWSQIKSIPQSVSRIRNTAIGTLLVDISEGKELEAAVASFEAKVAPTNYKRPTSLITKVMIEKAKQKIEELGLTSALERRFAKMDDITINNILFANRESKKKLNADIFDELSNKAPENIKNFDKVEEIGIEAFINNILPKAESLELMFENKHTGNLVSLIAPVDTTAKGMFKWTNNFSWSYAGELTDSIKERVKNAGGRVDGDLRCSLSWFNFDDLDLHMAEPGGHKIYYGNKDSFLTKGNLDVDMNAGSGRTRNAVENICYPDRKKMTEGIYKLQVNNFSKRESVDTGFEVEIEFDGVIHSFAYAKAVRDKDTITVAEVKYTHKNGFEIVGSLPSSQTIKEVWGIPTQAFHKVSVAMFSP